MSTSDAVQIKRAGFFLRVIAALVDLVIVITITWAVGTIWIRTSNPSDASDDWVMTFLLVSATYSIGFWTECGATPGKLLFRMRVVRMNGEQPIAWYQGVARWVSYLLSASVFGAGFLMAAFHPLKRTIHDLMSGTRVIRLSRRRGKSRLPSSEPEPCV
jgi:uncharacterized RDD family membrane protein YckC